MQSDCEVMGMKSAQRHRRSTAGQTAAPTLLAACAELTAAYSLSLPEQCATCKGFSEASLPPKLVEVMEFQLNYFKS